MHSEKIKSITLTTLFMLFTSPATKAGWDDWRQKLEAAIPGGMPTAGEATTLSQTEIIAGLKEALSVGVERATSVLGRDDGFLNDAAVKIPVPESLQQVERGLRKATCRHPNLEKWLRLGFAGLSFSSLACTSMGSCGRVPPAVFQAAQ